MPDDENSDMFPALVACGATHAGRTDRVGDFDSGTASDRHSASKPARSAPLPLSGQLILDADQRELSPTQGEWLKTPDLVPDFQIYDALLGSEVPDVG